MDQERMINESENEYLNEKDIQKEKSKRLLVIIIVLILAGIGYFYSISSNKPKKTAESLITNANKTLSETSAETNETNSEIKLNKNKIKHKKTSKKTSADKEAKKSFSKIKSIDKSLIIKIASAVSGKIDPFSALEGKLASSQKTVELLPEKLPVNKFFDSKKYTLPPPPLSSSNITELPPLENIPLPDGMSPPNADLINVKGFIGNKVIMDINGLSESLKTNELFQGIKILEIDPINLTVKFKKEDKIITEKIKSLTEVNNKEDLELVKNFRK
ncbi:MAG: hypothetical protein V2B14_00860 [bacterium]